MAGETDKKVLSVDEDTCIGCGNCASFADGYFEIKDGISVVAKEYDEKDADDIQEAIDNCPVQAITLK